MYLSFQHANPEAGNESFLLRFGMGADETACVLVDAGHGVDLDRLLGPTDRLVAICLTHAHLDHYSELSAAHRDDVPVFTSPATAAVLDDVFDVAGSEYDVETTDDVTKSITPIEDWTPVSPDIEIHPVPAGHVPGAAGFLMRVTDGDQSHHILATGDFTRRQAGGFPGLDAENLVDVDVLFLTGATNDDFETTITEAMGTALEHANGGAPTLLATSGLVGVHCAYLLSALADEYDIHVPVRVVGQVAKLYEALDYDCPDVEAIPYFQHTDDCLRPGAIVIAGPEIPTERSSGRLFGVLRDDPNACVVQLVGSGEDPLIEGKCTTHAYELANHPRRETLVEVHDAIEPTETVITHRHGGARDAFNDLSSVVWGAGDIDEYTLFDGNSWRLPPWMPGQTLTRDHGRSVGQIAGADLLASFSVPSIDRHEEPNLESEGIDESHIASLLHRGPGAATSRDAPSPDYQRDETHDRDTISTSMTTDSTDSTDGEESAGDTRPSTNLVRTTKADIGGGLDPDVQAALDEGSLTKEDLRAALAKRNYPTERDSESDGSDEDVAESEEERASKDKEDEADEAEARVDVGDDGEEVSVESEDEIENTAKADLESGPDEVPAEAASQNGSETEETESDAGEDESQFETNGTAEKVQAPEEDVDTSSPLDLDEEETDEALELDLDPLAVALAERALSGEGNDDTNHRSVDEVIVVAVDRYVLSLLSGEASGGQDERFTIDLAASEAVERTIGHIVDGDDRFESTTELVSAGVVSVLGNELGGKREIHGLESFRKQLGAIKDNEAFAFDDVEGIVEAAIAWSAETD